MIPNISKLQALLESVAPRWDVPGAIVSVIGREDVLFQGTYGVKSLAAGGVIDEDTVFQVGSITKSFTSAAAAILSDRGLLPLNKPIRDFVPEFALRDAMATERITISDFLSQNSGLPSHNLFWHGSYLNRQGFLARLRHLEPRWDMRTHWHYQNLNFMVAGALMERVSGRTWEALVQDELFTPLGLSGSSIGKAGYLAAPNRTVPHQPTADGGMRQNPPLDVVACAPAGAINMSHRDLNTWTRFHLNGGVHAGREIISKAAMAAIHTPRSVEANMLPLQFAEAPYSLYGLAWVIAPYRGLNLHYDGGNVEGFSGISVILPDEGIGITMQVNMHEANIFMFNLLYSMLDLLFFDDEKDWDGILHAAVADYMKAAGRDAADKAQSLEAGRTLADARPAAEYLGSYTHPGYGTLAVETHPEGIAIRFNDNPALLKENQTGVFPLAHYAGDRFTTRLASLGSAFTVVAEFGRDAAGNVTGLSVPFEPMVSAIVFERQ